MGFGVCWLFVGCWAIRWIGFDGGFLMFFGGVVGLVGVFGL